MGQPSEPLFSYGTLQYDRVQQEQFGRLLDGSPDILTGFRLDQVAITDAEVLRKSGTTYHPILSVSGDPSDKVDGTLYWITSSELAAVDEYEVDDYMRERVTLASGQEAWVYVAAAQDGAKNG